MISHYIIKIYNFYQGNLDDAKARLLRMQEKLLVRLKITIIGSRDLIEELYIPNQRFKAQMDST